MRNLLCIFFLLALTGCEVEYEDISETDEYAGFIGKRYETLQVLKVHGVTMEQNYGEDIDLYSITKSPGFSGPELITKFDLPIGSIVEIKKVLLCVNCVPSKIEFRVQVMFERLKSDIPTRLINLEIKDIEGGVILDPNYLE